MEREMLSFEELRPYLLHQFKNESQMLSSIEEVGKFFNFYRDNLDKYLNEERLVSAYCAYWLTTNYPKLFEVLKLLPKSFDISSFDRVVDIGTGPGTFMLALNEVLNKETQLWGVDTSELMLKQARALMTGLCPDREVYLGNKVPKGEAKNTLLLFTHSLNEMGAEKAQQYIELVKPSVILLMEPGTKDAFAKTLELRQWCVSKGFNVSYPCFSNSPCPLNLEEDWCHQYLKTRHAQDVESMTQKLGRDRKLLPMTIHLYKKEELSKNQAQGHTARLVRVYKQTKHSFEWMLCKEVEGQNITFNVEVPKRGMSKKEIKAFEEIMAGEEIHYSVEKEMEQKIRIKLI